MDLQAVKTVSRKIPYGFYAAGVKRDSELKAFTATWLTQVDRDEPALTLTDTGRHFGG